MALKPNGTITLGALTSIALWVAHVETMLYGLELANLSLRRINLGNSHIEVAG
jgi:hypothetical protein